MRYIGLILTISICTVIITYSRNSSAKETYEDYRTDQSKFYNERSLYRPRKRYNYNKPLSEMKTGERKNFMEDLRGAVRDEIDQSISKERRASKKKISEGKLIKEVRKIVREEINEAIRMKEKSYLYPGTFEAGGFVSLQTKGLEGSSSDNNFIVKVFPMISYFLGKNIALGVKGEAEFNFTTKKNSYNVGIGPQFVFGLTKKDDVCFYATIFAGVSSNSSLESNQFGYRYGNEMGIKFVLSSGVIFSLGAMIVFDNAGSIEGFQNIIVPALGITAWF